MNFIKKLGFAFSTNAKQPRVSFPISELKQRLSPEEFHVTQEKGTERAFTGEYWNNKENGTYHCIVCDEQLFE